MTNHHAHMAGSGAPPFSTADAIACKIKDALFIGTCEGAEDYGFLASNKITGVINCASLELANVWDKMGVTYMSYPFKDIDSTVILDSKDHVINECFRFIEETLERGEGILIHSMNGVSRSCTIAIAYLMKKYSWPLEKAFDYVLVKRPEMQLKPAFLRQLRAYSMRLGKDQGTSGKEKPSLAIDSEDVLLTHTYQNTYVPEAPEWKKDGGRMHSVRWIDMGMTGRPSRGGVLTRPPGWDYGGTADLRSQRLQSIVKKDELPEHDKCMLQEARVSLCRALGIEEESNVQPDPKRSSYNEGNGEGNTEIGADTEFAESGGKGTCGNEDEDSFMAIHRRAAAKLRDEAQHNDKETAPCAVEGNQTAHHQLPKSQRSLSFDGSVANKMEPAMSTREVPPVKVLYSSASSFDKGRTSHRPMPLTSLQPHPLAVSIRQRGGTPLRGSKVTRGRSDSSERRPISAPLSHNRSSSIEIENMASVPGADKGTGSRSGLALDPNETVPAQKGTAKYRTQVLNGVRGNTPKKKAAGPRASSAGSQGNTMPSVRLLKQRPPSPFLQQRVAGGEGVGSASRGHQRSASGSTTSLRAVGGIRLSTNDGTSVRHRSSLGSARSTTSLPRWKG